MKVRFAFLALPLLVGLSVSAWSAPVRFAEPASRSRVAIEPVRALLVPPGETTLSSPVSGTIKAIKASLGAGFGKGQVMIEFECDEPRARVNIGLAELAGAEEQYEAKVRMQGLEQASDVEVSLAASAVAKARAQVSLYRAQVAQCTVVAPWSGRVARVHAKSHMSVTPGQPLLELVQSGALRLKLNVPSRWVQDIKAGQRLAVTVDETQRQYPARILRINSRVDPTSQTVEMEAQFDSSFPDLLPGMSGVVEFTSLRSQGL